MLEQRPSQSRAVSTEQPKRNYLGLSTLADQLRFAGDHLGPVVNGQTVALFAHAHNDMNGNAERSAAALRVHGAKEIVVVHEKPSSEIRHILQNVDAAYLAGGNTFALVLNMEARRNSDGSLVDKRPGAATVAFDGDLIEQAAKGLPLVGTSAGLMVLGKNIRTCADPRSYADDEGRIYTNALGLIPVTFHPHYVPGNEAMAEELADYPKIDPSTRIVAVVDKTYIVVNGNVMTIEGPEGPGGAIIEASGSKDIKPGDDLSAYLR